MLHCKKDNVEKILYRKSISNLSTFQMNQKNASLDGQRNRRNVLHA